MRKKKLPSISLAVGMKVKFSPRTGKVRHQRIFIITSFGSEDLNVFGMYQSILRGRDRKGRMAKHYLGYPLYVKDKNGKWVKYDGR